MMSAFILHIAVALVSIDLLVELTFSELQFCEAKMRLSRKCTRHAAMAGAGTCSESVLATLLHGLLCGAWPTGVQCALVKANCIVIVLPPAFFSLFAGKLQRGRLGVNPNLNEVLRVLNLLSLNGGPNNLPEIERIGGGALNLTLISEKRLYLLLSVLSLNPILTGMVQNLPFTGSPGFFLFAKGLVAFP